MDTLAKISQNIFAYSFDLEHSKHFFYVEKKLAFFGGERSPPLTDASPKNATFFYVLPLERTSSKTFITISVKA